MVRPRSCRVIYYFDIPTLGKRHQSFGRVTKYATKVLKKFVMKDCCPADNPVEYETKLTKRRRRRFS